MYFRLNLRWMKKTTTDKRIFLLKLKNIWVFKCYNIRIKTFKNNIFINCPDFDFRRYIIVFSLVR